MKAFRFRNLALGGWVAAALLGAVAADASPNNTLIFEEMAKLAPSAISCISSSVLVSACTLADMECICTNEPLSVGIQTCLAANCTIKQQLQTLKFQKWACDVPSQDLGPSTRAIVIVLYAFSVTAVIARLIARMPKWGAYYYWDDWVIIACLAGLTPVMVIGIMMVNFGLGKDIWTLSDDQITNILFYFWIEEFLYTFEVVFTKISLLFLYLRIFPSTFFRKQCFVVGGVVLAFGIACVVTSILLCTPISYNWEQWDGEHQGRCANVNAQVYAFAGINMALDLCIFILPIPQLIPLEIKWKKKIAVILMFLVGLFVTICSVVRLQSLLAFGKSINPTLDYTEVGIWSIIEIDVGVICTCMPGIAALLRRMWPRVFESVFSGEGRSAGSYGGSGDSRSGSRLARLKTLAPRKIRKTTQVTIEYRPESDNKSEEVELVDRLPDSYRRFDHYSVPSEGKTGSRGWVEGTPPKSPPAKNLRFCMMARDQPEMSDVKY